MNLAGLNLIKAEQDNLRHRFRKAKEEYCKEHCPIKPGDKVTIEGYAYTGKSMIVDRIVLTEGYTLTGWIWHIFGVVINSNGKPGKNYTSFHKKVEE